MMRFALITDVHFGPKASFEGKLRKLSHHAARLTGEFVDHMNTIERPDLVVNLGDVIEDESPEGDERAYRSFVEILGRLDCPVMHVAGNHDSVHLDDTTLAALWQHRGPLYYGRTIAGIHFVVLRTRHHRQTDVHLPQEQLAWLRAELRRTGLPCVVLLHHPLGEMDLAGNRWFYQWPQICFVAEREQVRRIISESGSVIAVFNGHVHWNHFSVSDGIPYVTLQSLTENVDDDAPGRPARSYAIVDVEPGSLKIRVEGEHPARYQLKLDSMTEREKALL